MRIDGTTVVCASLGYPNKQSISPVLHNAGYRAFGLNNVFLALEVEPDRLEEAVLGARALGFRGCSVTKPFKEAVLPLLDRLDETASAIGAVNTILNEGGVLSGYNSDWIGAVRAIEGAAGVRPSDGPMPERLSLAGKRACVVGAGGAGKAIVWGLVRAGCRVVLYNRDQDKGRAVAGSLAVEFGGAPSALGEGGPFDILVNATSVGMGDAAAPSPIPASAFRWKPTVLDAVIHPRTTALLRAARAAGCAAVPGAAMLLFQGLFQFELFTGRKPPIETMRRALDRALR